MCHTSCKFCVYVRAVAPLASPSFFKKANMGDFKRISELIDTYYPEISERLKNGKRNGK